MVHRGKNNSNSIYKTMGSELSVTIWNVGVVTDCAMKMSVQWSVAIEKINRVQELLGENSKTDNRCFLQLEASGETNGAS